jgi:hypothetical protein
LNSFGCKPSAHRWKRKRRRTGRRRRRRRRRGRRRRGRRRRGRRRRRWRGRRGRIHSTQFTSWSNVIHRNRLQSSNFRVFN